MKQPNHSIEYAWMDERVEAYVDGDLPADERERFEAMLEAHPEWEKQVQYARRIQTELHTLPHASCPPQVLDAVFERTRQRTNGASATESWWNWVWRELDIEMHTGWKPALAFAMLLLVVVTSSLLTDPQNPAGLFDQPVTSSQQYSAAEIQAAETQAKWAIAYIAKVSQETGSTVENKVLEENLTAPVRRALRPLAAADRDSNPTQR